MEKYNTKAVELFNKGKEFLGEKGVIAVGLVSAWLLFKLTRKVVRGQGKSVKDDVVFITGAASGIGKQAAKNFAALGSKVVIADLNIEAATALQNELRDKGHQALAIECDVSSRYSVQQAAEITRREFGNVTILINNAGIVSGKSFMDTQLETMERTFRVNTISHFYTIKEFLPAMLEANKGHIVTIASLAGLCGVGGLVDYCASKYAAVGLDEALRSELKSKKSNVKTTCVCPYFINTGMFEGVKLKYSFVFPLLDEVDVGRQIVSAIRHNEVLLVLPGIAKLNLVLKAVLPTSFFEAINVQLGFNEAMSTFNGRGAQA